MSLSRPLQAILLMLVSMVGFSAMTTTIRILSESMHSTQMVLMRNVVSFILIILWCAWLQRGMPAFKTTRMRGHFWRATVGILAMEVWFYSLTIMPLTLATALSFTTPIFSTIIAILFLRERAGMRRWAAILAGFAGMLIILRPDLGVIDPKAFFVIFASMMMAVAGVLVKTLTRTESPEAIVFYMTFFMIPWSVAPAVLHWQPFTAYQAWLILLISLFSTVSHLTMTRAFQRVDLVVLMPFDFTRLIFTALFAYICFGEVMDEGTLMGALVIVAATVYIAHREAVQKRKNPSSHG